MPRPLGGGLRPHSEPPPNSGIAPAKPALERRLLGRAPSRLSVAAVLGAGLWLLSPGRGSRRQGAASPPDAGAEARPPLLLNLTRPIETPERALREAAREDARAPRSAGPPDFEVLPDGSVRIGRTRISVTVKEECPEEPHMPGLLPRPLPGRSRR